MNTEYCGSPAIFQRDTFAIDPIDFLRPNEGHLCIFCREMAKYTSTRWINGNKDFILLTISSKTALRKGAILSTSVYLQLELEIFEMNWE